MDTKALGAAILVVILTEVIQILFNVKSPAKWQLRRVALGLLISLAVGLVAYFATARPLVTVPSLDGLSKDEAADLLQKNHLVPNIVQEQPKQYIVSKHSQSPAAGIKVSPDTVVTFSVGNPQKQSSDTSVSNQKLDYDSSFVSDLTYPDKPFPRIVHVGKKIKKVWRIKNEGLKTWINFSIKNIDETSTGLRPIKTIYPLGKKIVKPEETVDVTVYLIAEDVRRFAVSNWKLAFSDGSLVYPNNERTAIFCKVEVK